MSTPKDKNGRQVFVGSRVRLVELPSNFLASLPPEEVEAVRAMIGEVFEVYEIDQYGSPWVEATRLHGEGRISTHAIALDSNEMELLE